MRVLLVKMSSLGDVVHLLPAVTEACAQRPDIVFDWLVEEAFTAVPGWHRGIARVLPVALRRWRRAPLAARVEFAAARSRIAAQSYDLIIDAQGLLKSALMAWLAGRKQSPSVPVAGFAASCAREPMAARFYSTTQHVAVGEHAIARLRQLLALTLDYTVNANDVDYGLQSQARDGDADSLLFVHATTWASKHYPVAFFRDLAARAGRAGLRVQLPHGNDAEAARAHSIADGLSHVDVLPRMPLSELGPRIAAARGVIGCDSGLAHLAAAFGVPTVIVHAATNADRTGVRGRRAVNVSVDGARFGCAPCLARSCHYRGPAQLAGATAAAIEPACFASTPPALVWTTLRAMLS